MPETGQPEPDQELIVGGPVESALPGSKLYRCVTCGERVALARSGQRYLKQHQAKVTCMACLAKMGVKPDQIRVPSLETVLSDLQSEN